MFCHVLDCTEKRKKKERRKKKEKKLRATFISYPSRVNEIFQLTVYPVSPSAILRRFKLIRNLMKHSNETSFHVVNA